MMVVETIAAVNRAGDALSFARGGRGRWLSTTLLCQEGRFTERYSTMEEAEQDLLRIQREARTREQ
jgi:hypothetical protein